MATIIRIDRSKPIHFALIGKDTIEEQDEKSLCLTECDLDRVQLETCLENGISSISSERRLARLKEKKCIRLDARIFQEVLGNLSKIPESWKSKWEIHFNGTTMQDASGNRYIFCLVGDTKGHWKWGVHWLANACQEYTASAVL